MSYRVKKYLYEGLGFPLILEDVEMVLIKGKYAPKIDIKKIAMQAALELNMKESLTYEEAKFMGRIYERSLEYDTMRAASKLELIQRELWKTYLLVLKYNEQDEETEEKEYLDELDVKDIVEVSIARMLDFLSGIKEGE